MARTMSAQVASASRLFLQALSAPTTDDMVRAVAAWLYQESGGRIVGNNPWNLHSSGGLPGQTGSRYAGPGDKNVAVFATLQDGCNASAANLIRLAPSYGYSLVIQTARSGDAVPFLDALAASSWSAGHYGGPGPKNKLRSVYASLGGAVPAGQRPSSTPTSPSSSSTSGTVLAVFTATPAGTCTQITILEPANGLQDQVLPIPRENIGDPCTACPTGWNKAIYDPGIKASIPILGGAWVPISDLPPNTANACVAPGVRVGDRPELGQAGDVTGVAAIGQAIGQLPGELGNVAVHVAILLLALGLIFVGLRAVALGSAE